jgi:hypothetical protein
VPEPSSFEADIYIEKWKKYCYVNLMSNRGAQLLGHGDIFKDVTHTLIKLVAGREEHSTFLV